MGLVGQILNLLSDPKHRSEVSTLHAERAQCPSSSLPVVRAPARRAGQRRLAPDEVDELVAAYSAGGMIEELAARFGVNRLTVMRHLARKQVARRVRGLDPADLPQAMKLYSEGWSAARLGQRFGVDQGTVLRRLREHGVTIRARRGWPRETHL